MKFIVLLLGLLSAVVGGAQTLTPFTLILDWYPNPNHAPILLAELQGLFQKQHLQVKLKTPGDTQEGEKLVALGRADLALTYQPSFIANQNMHLHLKQVASLIRQPLSCLVVLENRKIQTLADLKGKRIGYSGSAVDQWILATMLQSVGVRLQEVKLINVKFNLLPALLSEQLDGFVGGMRNFEPYAIALAGKKARLFYPEQHGVKPYEELIFVAKRSQAGRAEIQRFILALTQAVTLIKKRPEFCWQVLTKAYPELNTELNRRSWLVTVEYF